MDKKHYSFLLEVTLETLSSSLLIMELALQHGIAMRYPST